MAIIAPVITDDSWPRYRRMRSRVVFVNAKGDHAEMKIRADGSRLVRVKLHGAKPSKGRP